ncbi:unnamed protein product [Periconia digitata]|uniref:Ketosynthase family 3 (KS3) domain-containing protein n=1 Tax=Periconia digitata TaxID=1303443 RepID=A0A9W4ULI7_9PLEO|nr:unnamed protein product [Periconia digitata]
MLYPAHYRFNTGKFYHTNPNHHGTANVKKGYFLDHNPAAFDAAFFNINPREAEAIDPQQRMHLELVYEVIESAGYSIEALQGSKTGVFAGLMCADYFDVQLRDLMHLSQYHSTGTARSLLSNHASYIFDWSGPSVTIDTACSSSLVAVHLAAQSLRSNDCDLAVASGLLKHALRDGDHIEIVIHATGVNSDARTQGITKPSSTSQAELIRATFVKAGLRLSDPDDQCQFFEAQGTGTQSGDIIEAEAIHDVFHSTVSSQNLKQKLYVGSIKTVIGHLEGTAGIAGLLKASLSIQNGVISPNLQFSSLNPGIVSNYTQLHVPTNSHAWPTLPDHVLTSLLRLIRALFDTQNHDMLWATEPELVIRHGATWIPRIKSVGDTYTSLSGSQSSMSIYRNEIRIPEGMDRIANDRLNHGGRKKIPDQSCRA